MKNKRIFLNGMFVIAVAGTLTSCIDNSYDMSKDIDMTVGLGAQGLKLNLGNSEKIMLGDVLEVDKEEMLETDADGTFYLVKSDKADFSFEVETFTAEVDVASLSPDLPLLKYEDFPGAAGLDEYPISSDRESTKLPLKVESTDLFNISNFPKEVKELKRIFPKNDSRDVTVSLELTSNDTSNKFVVESYENVVVTLPDFFNLTDAEGKPIKNEITLPAKSDVNQKSITLAKFTVESLDLSGMKDNEIHGSYAVSGDFSIKASEAFNLKKGAEISICVTIQIGGKKSNDRVEVEFAEVEGKFAPTINPNIDPINIASDVPDFLTDSEVCIMAANPTFRLDVNMTEIPADLTMMANLYAEKTGVATELVQIPGNGSVIDLLGSKLSTIYISQEAEAYDPNGVVPSSTTCQVADLNNLIKSIPDVIRIDMADNKVRLADKLTTIALGKTYDAAIDYNVYVPFKFNNGLKIVYTEDIEDLNEDIKDVAAEGAKITAKLNNKVPLALNLTAELFDVDGNKMDNVSVSQVTVPASQESEIALQIEFADAYDLKKLDKLSLKVTAETTDNNQVLTSEQYIQLQDLTFELLDQIILDLN